jgi:hypothetical protein
VWEDPGRALRRPSVTKRQAAMSERENLTTFSDIFLLPDCASIFYHNKTNSEYEPVELAESALRSALLKKPLS